MPEKGLMARLRRMLGYRLMLLSDTDRTILINVLGDDIYEHKARGDIYNSSAMLGDLQARIESADGRRHYDVAEELSQATSAAPASVFSKLKGTGSK